MLQFFSQPQMTTIKNKFNKWADWLINYIPPKPKAVDSLLEKLKKTWKSQKSV